MGCTVRRFGYTVLSMALLSGGCSSDDTDSNGNGSDASTDGGLGARADAAENQRDGREEAAPGAGGAADGASPISRGGGSPAGTGGSSTNTDGSVASGGFLDAGGSVASGGSNHPDGAMGLGGTTYPEGGAGTGGDGSIAEGGAAGAAGVGGMAGEAGGTAGTAGAAGSGGGAGTGLDGAPDAESIADGSAGDGQQSADGEVAADAPFEDEGGTTTPESDATADHQGDAQDVSLPANSWRMGSEPVCRTETDVYCFVDEDDPDLNAYLISASAQPTCSTGGMLTLWLPEQDPPSPGDYEILAASDESAKYGVTASGAVIKLRTNAPTTENWWGQSGVVHVELVDGKTTLTFESLPIKSQGGASETSLTGHIVCP